MIFDRDRKKERERQKEKQYTPITPDMLQHVVRLPSLFRMAPGPGDHLA